MRNKNKMVLCNQHRMEAARQRMASPCSGNEQGKSIRGGNNWAMDCIY